LPVFNDHHPAAGALDLHPDIGQPERRCQRAGDRSELLVRIRGRLESLGQRRHRRVRIIAGAADETPCPTPEPASQRCVDHGDDRDRDQGGIAFAEDAAGDGEHRQVDADDKDREYAVQEGGPRATDRRRTDGAW